MDLGNWAEWVAIGASLLIGIGGFITGILANQHAKKAATEAETANELADRANKLAEEVRDAAALTNPLQNQPWSKVEHRSGSRYEVTNGTSRRVLVRAVTADDERFAGLLRADAGVLVDAGDSYSFMASFTMGGGPDRVTISWSWDGDEEAFDTSREVRR